MKREQTGQMWRGLSATVLAIVLQVGQWSASGCGLLRRAVSESLCGARLERVESCEESNRGPGGSGGAEDMKWLRVPERLGTNDLPMFLLTCFFCRSGRAASLFQPARVVKAFGHIHAVVSALVAGGSRRGGDVLMG